jgi:hypothetical protein
MTNKILRNIVWGSGPVVLVVGAIAYASQTASVASDRVKRGAYLVSTSACNDCHTPWKMGPNGPEPDMTRMLSGHPETVSISTPPAFGNGPWTWASTDTNTAFAGPWGLSYAFNLTPDRNTGLGIWTEEMFVTAIRTGRHMGVSRPIAPPMPWAVYRNFTDEDLKSIFAFLRTIPPIVNHVAEYTPPPATQTARESR